MAAALIVLLALGLGLWLALRDRDDGEPSATHANVSAASVQQIKDLAASLGQPIYWLGTKRGYTYELTRTRAGSIFIRYLPPGVDVGDPQPYLTVATYPFPRALAGIRGVKGSDVVSFDIPRGGVAEYSKSYPVSVHLAYPRADYQAEVYDPTPGNAKAIALAGQVTALGEQRKGAPAQVVSEPTAATVGDLKRVAKSLGHPLYWAGPKSGYTYELTQAPDGAVFVRYLPPGVDVGALEPYLSVATYPFPGAFGATTALSKAADVKMIDVPGGGIAVVKKAYPESVHVAYPGSDYQVELFDPSAATASRLVASGQLSPVG